MKEKARDTTKGWRQLFQFNSLRPLLRQIARVRIDATSPGPAVRFRLRLDPANLLWPAACFGQLTGPMSCRLFVGHIDHAESAQELGVRDVRPVGEHQRA